ncbi:MAG: hypothetical protein JJ879_02085 [Sneathiella sp.]|nr:hypothetical protein [Sneathiella sp.]
MSTQFNTVNGAGVLEFPANTSAGGYRVDLNEAGDVSSYTLVFDLYYAADQISSGYGGLFQTDPSNGSDADFFMKMSSPTSFGLGISSQYQGDLATDAWHRVAITVDDQGDGTSILTAYANGEKINEISEDTGRFTIDADNGLILLTDNDGETNPGYLNSFLLVKDVLDAGTIAELGGATTGGILSAPLDVVSATQFDFDGQDLSPTFGPATMEDRANPDVVDQPVALINPIKDMMVTPDTENLIVDLSNVFEGDNLTYSVTTSDGDVVSIVSNENGILELDFDALGHSDIIVTATDNLGNEESDWFRARVAGPNAYTFAVLPDTQDYTSNGSISDTFGNMTQWLADNAEAKNLSFVMHVGDVTQNNTPAQWEIAQKAYENLDGVVPYSVLAGNHDQGPGGSASDFTSRITDYFPVEKFSKENGGTLGGVYKDNMANNYHTVEAPDGTKWLILSLEFGTRDDVIDWAGSVIEDHLDHRVILNKHFYMNFNDRGNPLSGPLFAEGTGHNYGIVNSPEGASDGEEVWQDLLSKYPNVSFTFSGHVFGDGAETLVSYTDYGTPVHQMVVNYQGGVAGEIVSNGVDGRGVNGGNGAIRLVTIDPDNDRVTTETYFVENDEYLTSSREKEEYDRDGLTGKYREHEETFEDMDIEAPTLYAKAKAGDDQFVKAEEGDKFALVTLDGAKSIDPNSEIVSYKWVDADGHVIAEGKTVSVELEGGRHDLKLVTTDVNGVENSDDIRIIVETEDTLLLDNFNDGDFDGWQDRNQVSETPLDEQIALGLPTDFEAPAIPGGDAVVVSFPRSTKNQGYHVELDFEPESGDKFLNYTMMFDILFPAQDGSYGAFFQTDINNVSDADAFFRVGDGIGISGQYEGDFSFDTWHRVAFSFEEVEGGKLLMKKFIDGVKVGEQDVDAGRFGIDPETGFLILTDDGGEIFNGLMNSFLFTGETLSEEKIAELGGVDPDGILTAEEAGDRAIQFDFDTGFEATFGGGELGVIDLTTSDARATWKVKGSVASREDEDDPDLPAVEGALYEYSDGNAVMVWNAEEAANWSDYVMEATVLSQDDDTIGVAVYYQDEDNHYRVTLDVTTNERNLIKVKDGVETVLASEAGGYPFNDEMELKVAVVGDQIFVSLDGHALFEGPVSDAENALTNGTVALLSAGQYQTIFDDITVNKAVTHANAGNDLDIVDFDGDHKAEVTLNAENSFSKEGIVSYTWMLGGDVLGEGKELTVELPTGTHNVKLVVTDGEGEQHVDHVKVNLFNQEQVLLSDDFNSSLGSDWAIVDEGEKGDAADWSVADGSLTQSADTYSRELAPGSEDGGVWTKYWSPHGDGWHVLRKGTYALYDNADAYNWSSYVVETEFTAVEAGGVGILFNYQDDKNYYKLELDSDDRFVQLTVLVDGIEQSLMLTRNGFDLNEVQKLRVEVQDNKIQAYLNGMALFSEAIEERSIEKGTVGLYSWGTEGVSFDNILVRELQAEESSDPVVEVPDGTNGSDIIVGSDEDDYIDGKGGADQISGGEGDDVVNGGNGSDNVEGNDGDDELNGGNGSDGLSGNEGDDYVKGGNGSDLLDGGDGDDYLIGGNGSDRLKGGDGDDLLKGGNGSDLLEGGAGSDVLQGGNGSDVLKGGEGDDYLHGGNGADMFVFTAGHDEIKGFKSGQDRITIDGFDAAEVEYAIDHAEEVGKHLVITFDDDNSLTLLKTDLDDIREDDFVIMV